MENIFDTMTITKINEATTKTQYATNSYLQEYIFSHFSLSTNNKN